MVLSAFLPFLSLFLSQLPFLCFISHLYLTTPLLGLLHVCVSLCA